MMSKLKKVIEKLRRFTIRYYVSELIKGILLFFSSGALYLFFILFFISIFPGTALYMYIRNEHNDMIIYYNDMNTSYNTMLKKLNGIKAEIDEIDNSCRCLDTYIDEI